MLSLSCSMCKHIRSIPARTSERRALYGHDPTHLVRVWVVCGYWWWFVRIDVLVTRVLMM
jgi:hypothetical protein